MDIFALVDARNQQKKNICLQMLSVICWQTAEEN